MITFVLALSFLVYELSLKYDVTNMKTTREIKAFPSAAKKKLYKPLGKHAGIMRKRLDNLNMRDRGKSYTYKYFSMMSSVISSLELQKFTNPESVLLLMALISVVVSIVLTIGLGMVVKVLTFFTCLVLLHAVLLFISHTSMLERMLAIMDAEDLLASNMEDGILVSVQKSLNSIDVKIRPIFSDFFTEASKSTDGIELAMVNFNMRLGSSMNSFCENALTHYKDNDSTSLKYFKDGIEKNTKKRILINKQQYQYRINMMMYTICMCICIAFGVIASFIVGEGLAYYSSAAGRIVTIISAVFIIGGFVASQLIYFGGVD